MNKRKETEKQESLLINTRAELEENIPFCVRNFIFTTTSANQLASFKIL